MVFWIALVLLLAVPAAEAGPKLIVDFAGKPASGSAPLSVSFTDQSKGSPSGWAWYFGDETYTNPWTRINGSLGTLANKSFFSLVATPDGSIVLMGGCNHGPGNTCVRNNETWRSVDYGNTWTQVNASSGWSPRGRFTSVALPDNHIILMGGYGGNHLRDVWVSGNHGSTWTLVNASGAPWQVRKDHNSVVLPDGSIVMTGGWYKVPQNSFNDTWRSTDQGKTWVLMNGSSGWALRSSHSMVALPDGSIVLTGGYCFTSTGAPFISNETWRSTDAGRTWTLVNANSGWAARYSHASVAMPDNSILLMGGYGNSASILSDSWRSDNNGKTWTLVNVSPGWPAGVVVKGVTMPDSSVIVITDGDFYDRTKNEIWRLVPSGSTLQNPRHTYTVPGKYQVALQAYDNRMYNSTRKTGFIRVNWAFTKGDSGGGVPLPTLLPAP